MNFNCALNYARIMLNVAANNTNRCDVSICTRNLQKIPQKYLNGRIK